MLRLAKLQMPVFFCFLAFEGHVEPVRVYFVHLGEDLITRTLERVRQLSAAGDRDLGRHTLSVNYDESHALEQPLHDGLKKAVDSHMPDGMSAYIAWKNGVLNSAGYADPRVTADIAFDVQNRSELVDLFLGLKETVELKRLLVMEHRFGIGETIEPDVDGPGTLSITDHPTTEGKILIRKDAYSAALTFPVHSYFPPPAMNLPDDELKVRIIARTFEILLRPYSNRLTLKRTLNADAPYALRDLRACPEFP